MSQMPSTTSSRVDFIELLCQEFLSTKGYGAFVYLTSYHAAELFSCYTRQHQSDKEFIKEYVRSFAREGFSLPS